MEDLCISNLLAVLNVQIFVSYILAAFGILFWHKQYRKSKLLLLDLNKGLILTKSVLVASAIKHLLDETVIQSDLQPELKCAAYIAHSITTIMFLWWLYISPYMNLIKAKKTIQNDHVRISTRKDRIC